MILEKKVVTENSFPFISAAGKKGFKEAGYVEEEYFMKGTANVYKEEGNYKKSVIHENIPYCNRIIVRKPKCDEDCSGDVMIEILNSTAGFDIDRVWILGDKEIMRQGAVYIGITSKPDVIGCMKKFDPERYQDISWKVPYIREEKSWWKNAAPRTFPRDEKSETGLFWDMLTDLAAYVRNDNEIIPGGKAKFVYLLGWSQSVGYMTTYRNYFAFSEDGRNPCDGYFAAGGVPAARVPINQDDYGRNFPFLSKVTYMPVPYIAVQTESENVGFGSYDNRQENSETENLKYRVYEIAGATHDTMGNLITYYDGDDYLERVGVRPQYSGDNEYPNDFPYEFAIYAILRHLIRWVRDGILPPTAPRIELDENLENSKDELGNSKGGVRLPQIDAPVGIYYNYSDRSTSPDGKNPLFGHVEPFTAKRLGELYGSLEAYRKKVTELAKEKVEQGYLLEEDAEACIKQAVDKAAAYGL